MPYFSYTSISCLAQKQRNVKPQLPQTTRDTSFDGKYDQGRSQNVGATSQGIKTLERVNPVSADTRSVFSGWRLGAYCSATLAITSLMINTGVVIWLAKIRPPNAELVEVFKGDCMKVKRLGTWVHLAINVIAALLLGGSSYCMQCLASPTRLNVDAAHASRSFLDIGILSIRNLKKVAKRKVWMWLMLAFTSLPLHLLYNSAFYISLANHDYEIYLANHTLVDSSVNITTNFLPGSVGPANLTIVRDGRPGDFHRLETIDCIHEYARTILTSRRNVVLVTNNTTEATVNGLQHLGSSYFDYNIKYAYSPFNWICSSDPWINSKIGIHVWDLQQKPEPCDNYVSRIEAVAEEWTPYNYTIEYCLSEQVAESCSFNANFSILIVVIICNAIKALIMFIVASRINDDPLITIGDAIETFLDRPDPMTKGHCWMTKQDFVRQAWSKKFFSRAPQPQSCIHTPAPARINLERRFWGSAVNALQWGVTIPLFAATLVMSWTFLNISLRAIHQKSKTVGLLGFGQLDASAIISSWSIASIERPSLRILASTLIANTPQTIISLLYFFVNGFVTSMWIAAEWANFAKERKYLRVSNPKGKQRSTHFLHVPYQVAIPLLITWALLHWLVSQSIFLVVITNNPSSGAARDILDIVSCCFSPMAIILTTATGIAIILALFFFAFRPLEPGIPLVGSCSAAISAACHPPSWDDKASLQKVQYGAIPGDELTSTVGHCSFSSGEVRFPDADTLYAGFEQPD